MIIVREIKEMIIPLKEGKGKVWVRGRGMGASVAAVAGLMVLEEPAHYEYDEEPEVEGDTIECKFYFKGTDKVNFRTYFIEFLNKLVEYDKNFAPNIIKGQVPVIKAEFKQ